MKWRVYFRGSFWSSEIHPSIHYSLLLIWLSFKKSVTKSFWQWSVPFDNGSVVHPPCTEVSCKKLSGLSDPQIVSTWKCQQSSRHIMRCTSHQIPRSCSQSISLTPIAPLLHLSSMTLGNVWARRGQLNFVNKDLKKRLQSEAAEAHLVWIEKLL